MERSRVLTRPFALVWLSSFATLAATGMLIPVLPVYADDELGVGRAGIGLLVAAGTPAAILLQPLLGRYADRRGRRLVLVTGPLVYAASIASFSFADAFWLLLLLRVVAGAGEGALYMAPATVVNDLAPPERRGEAVSLFSLSVWGGIAVGAPLGEVVLRDTHFTSVWLAAAALALAGAALASRVPETRPDRPADHRAGLVARGALLPSGILIAELVGYAAIASFTPLYARELGMSGAGLVFAVNACVVLAIRGLGRKLPDRLGPRRGVVTGLLTNVAGLVVVAATAHPAGLFVGTAMFYCGHSLLYPALMVLVLQRTSAAEQSSAVGLFSASAQVGFALGAISLGAFADRAGYGWGFALAAVVVALGLTAVPALRRGGPALAAAPGTAP